MDRTITKVSRWLITGIGVHIELSFTTRFLTQEELTIVDMAGLFASEQHPKDPYRFRSKPTTPNRQDAQTLPQMACM
ncbi:hypothetical protein IJ380_01695 [Candidatus Saccharibacteria bacterium]|nr:hypothetical protein [Candidatus Saccharibacteria bacterium]